MSGIAAISGVVRKDGVAVEGAKVYILHDGEVVSSGESDESGEYSCGGLSLDNKYHAVVEYEEVDGDDIVLYSAKSMPGIEPISGIVYLYNEGEGGENWYVYDGTKKADHIEIEATMSTGEQNASASHTSPVDLTTVNYVAIEYLKGEDYGPGSSNYCSLEVGGLKVRLPYTDTKATVRLDVSSLSVGDIYVEVHSYQEGYSQNPIWIYKVWLE